MLLRHLEDARAIFTSLPGSLIGVGMTAYSRIIPSYFNNNYRIVALRKTADLEIIRGRAEVFCLEEEIGGSVKEPGFQSARLLSHPLTLRYLKGVPRPIHFFLYQSYPELEALARRENWNLLANPAALRTEVGSRLFFNVLIQRLGLKQVPGLIVPIQELWNRPYGHWARNVGPRLAVQLPEILQGGGRGTFFIRSEEEFKALQERTKPGYWRGCRLETLSVRRFIDGVPASVALCLTGNGILFSHPQIQLLDFTLSRSIPENGVFCGHSWGGISFPPEVIKDILAQAGAIGEHMRGIGYRGILGIDLVVEERTGRVYLMEINPRLTGAFPMLSQLHIERGLIPLEAFHLLEFLGLPYQMEVSSLNREYGESVTGSHLILFVMEKRRLEGKPAVRGGLYEMGASGREARYVKPAMDYAEIQKESQWIIVDGPPDGELGFDDPLTRICRLLFRQPMERSGDVRPKESARRAAEWVYRQMFSP